jgi:hypothetical protein
MLAILEDILLKTEDDINRDARGCKTAQSMWDTYLDLEKIDRAAATTAAMTFMSLIFNAMKKEDRLAALYHLNMTAEMFQNSESTEDFKKKVKEFLA